MIIDIITLFPEVFKPLLESSLFGKAQKKGKLKVNLIDLRDFGLGRHKQVDDRPYGGGVGMVLMVEPIYKAIQKAESAAHDTRVILLTPQGKTLNQKIAQRLAKEEHLTLICGHYEGVDERVRELVDEEISIGDYVLSGGEVPAMVVLETVVRLIPGVLEKEAVANESFGERLTAPTPSGRGSDRSVKANGNQQTLLEPPQYTRPEVFQADKRKLIVPKILLSGNHQEIRKWRLKEGIKKTKRRRPDLIRSKGR